MNESENEYNKKVGKIKKQFITLRNESTDATIGYRSIVFLL